MEYADFLRKAKVDAERRRTMAEAQAEERKQHIYELLPQLQDIDVKRTQLGTAAAGLAADGQTAEAQQKLNEVKKLELKKESLLNSKGFNTQDLQPKYSCAFCCDTGVAKGRHCECIQQSIKELRRKDINEKGALKTVGFENFSLEKYPEQLEGLAVSPRKRMAEVLESAKSYVQSFGPSSESIYMYGNSGLGKTHLALSIASEVLNKGYDVIYISAQSAFADVSEHKYSGGGALFASMLSAELLILDDLGAENLDNYILSMLYQLINSRMNNRPTIYTSNICSADLLNMRYTEKIASRLLGSCHRMPFLGNDIRLMN